MSHLNENNILLNSIARRAVSDETWFKRLSADERDRCVVDIATEMASAANGQIDHYRENLGAFDSDHHL